jgi:hypothetical protein
MSWILRIDKALAGAPNDLLTLLLIGLAAVALLIAFTGNPTTKAAVAAWFILP